MGLPKLTITGQVVSQAQCIPHLNRAALLLQHRRTPFALPHMALRHKCPQAPYISCLCFQCRHLPRCVLERTQMRFVAKAHSPLTVILSHLKHDACRRTGGDVGKGGYGCEVLRNCHSAMNCCTYLASTLRQPPEPHLQHMTCLKNRYQGYIAIGPVVCVHERV